jgi:hypothetical protein
VSLRKRAFSPAPTGDRDAPVPDAIGALTAFETSYRETYPNPFWMLFGHYMPETPFVDF